MTRFVIASTIENMTIAGTTGGKHFWNVFLSGDRISGPLMVNMTTEVKAPLTRKLRKLVGRMMLFEGVMADGELFAKEVRPVDGTFPYVRLDGDGTVVRVQPWYGAEKLIVRTDADLHIGLINNGRKVREGSVIDFSAFMRNGNIMAAKINVVRHPESHLDFGISTPEIARMIDLVRGPVNAKAA